MLKRGAEATLFSTALQHPGFQTPAAESDAADGSALLKRRAEATFFRTAPAKLSLTLPTLHFSTALQHRDFQTLDAESDAVDASAVLKQRSSLMGARRWKRHASATLISTELQRR